MSSDKYTPQAMQRVKDLLAKGYRLSRVAARLGLSEDALRCRLDARYRKLRNERRRQARGYGVRDDATRDTMKTAQEVLASLPPDARSRHARWMGDPPTGRSALDRKRSDMESVA